MPLYTLTFNSWSSHKALLPIRHDSSSSNLLNTESPNISFAFSKQILTIMQTEPRSVTEHDSKYRWVLNRKVQGALLVFCNWRCCRRVWFTAQYQLNVLFMLTVIMMQLDVGKERRTRRENIAHNFHENVTGHLKYKIYLTENTTSPYQCQSVLQCKDQLLSDWNCFFFLC